MFISDENDQIPLVFENGVEGLKCSDVTNDIPQNLEDPPLDSPVDEVPEHTQSDLGKLISKLEEEIVGLRSKQKKFDEKRKSSLNKILDIKGSIRVFCRIRPVSCNNTNKKIEEPILVDSDKILVKSAGIKKDFEFDKVFCQSSIQEDVFVEVEPILRSALHGHNVCILAYGQTGTGKTFTMEGTNDQPGIVPRALKELFQQAALETTTSMTFSMSMLEVYMGNLKDLLAPRPTRRAYEPITRCNLNIQADSKGVVEIEGLTEVPISDFSKAKWWYAKGRRARATASTSVNEASSRSHCLTRITICHHGDAMEGEARTSKLWMVDLGGSERLLKTGATGLTLDEGRAINLSLSALADVVASLRKRRPHVPYRNSKLTQILRDSLGNDSKVLMVVHISSIVEDLGETICSMSFAKRARAIESNQELPEDLKNHKLKKIAELNDEMKAAEEEYQTVSKQLKKAEFLLRENNRVYSSTCDNVEDENTPGSTKNDKDIEETPLDSEKTARRKSLPHFMVSTAASRGQRQSHVENHFTAKVLRSGTRSSMPNTASQSLSFMDSRLKTALRNGNRNQQDKMVNNMPTDTQNHQLVEPNSCSTPRGKSLTPSYPTSRVIVPRHKRRVSSLI